MLCPSLYDAHFIPVAWIIKFISFILHVLCNMHKFRLHVLYNIVNFFVEVFCS